MKTDKIAELKKRVSLIEYAGTRLSLTKRGGEYWACCPFHGEKTPSFAIKKKTNGDELFFCQGCGKGGDVIRFVEMLDNCTTKVALEKLSATVPGLGEVKQPAPAEPEWNEQYKQVTNTFKSAVDEAPVARVEFNISKWPPFETALKENTTVLAWLLDKRGITAETAALLHLGYSQTIKEAIKEEDEEARDKGWILFPRFLNGKVVAVKMRSIFLKTFSQKANMDPKALFNVETVSPLDPVFVTEGEFDAVVLEQAGYHAVSIPSASNAKFTPASKNALKQATEVFLAGDNDGKVGTAAMYKLARDLGKGAYILLWPGAKDANEFFLNVCGGNVEKFTEELPKLMETARATPVPGFTRTADQFDSGEDIDMSKDPDRLHFPWKEVDDMHYTPNGYVSIFYSTYTGTGKTVFTTQVMIHEAKRGETVVVYSPEIKRDPYKALIAAQMLGPERPDGLNRAGRISKEDQQAAKRRFDITYEALEKIPMPDGSARVLPEWYHVKRGLPDSRLEHYTGYEIPYSDTEEILDFIEYTVRVIGPTRFVIDTLHRIIQAPEGESQAQADARAIKRLEKIAAEHGCLFVVIGQSNKEGDDLKEVRKDSYGVLRGSREFSDVASSVYLLHRKKVDRPEAGIAPDDLLENKAELILRKIRLQGPGKPVTYLTYVKKNSTFELWTGAAEPESHAAAPMSSDEESQGW